MKTRRFLAIPALWFLFVALMVPSINASSGSGTLPIASPIPYAINSTQPDPPWVAGYAAADPFFAIRAIGATVNFHGTPQSAVQSDNGLGAGIAGTVFSSTVDNLDYGYSATAILYSIGIYLHADVWSLCEGFINSECGPASATNIFSTTFTPGTPIQATDSINLYMTFIASTAYWYYSINGGPEGIFASFVPPSDSQTHFNVGTYWVWFNGVTAKYFQFFLTSAYNIGHGGWNVDVDYPYYILNGVKTYVPKAYSVQGHDAYIDAVWKWGGEEYQPVWACYAYNSVPNYTPCAPPNNSEPNSELRFYYATLAGLPNGQLLWDWCDPQIQTDAGITGDAGNSFNDARSGIVTDGRSYKALLYSPCYVQDTQDWYKFYVSASSSDPKTITVTVTPPSDTALWIEIYKPPPSSSLWSGQYTSTGAVNSHTSTLCSSGEWRSRIFIGSFSGNPGPGGPYTLCISITSAPSGACGGGGSVMAGTLIQMADGSQRVVQNVQAGMQILSFDPGADSFYTGTVTSVVTKSVDNMYVIETDQGIPVRVDYWEEFWVRVPSGVTAWMVAGNIQSGFQIYRPVEGVWATVTSNTLSIGQYTVYDLIITPTLQDPPGMMPLIANGYLDAKVP